MVYLLVLVEVRAHDGDHDQGARPNPARPLNYPAEKRPKKDQSGKRPGEFGNTPARAIPDFMGIPDHPEPPPNDPAQGVNGDRRKPPETTPRTSGDRTPRTRMALGVEPIKSGWSFFGFLGCTFVGFWGYLGRIRGQEKRACGEPQTLDFSANTHDWTRTNTMLLTRT